MRVLQLARTPSQCRRAYILPVLSFFFSTPNLWGHWTDLNQTWTHIHLRLLFEKFGPNSTGHLPPRAGGKPILVPTLNCDWTYLCNGTWHQQSNRNLSIYRDSPTCPQILWTLVQKRLRTIGDFLSTRLNFRTKSHWQPYRMDVIYYITITDSRQLWHVLCSGTSLQSRTTECWGFAMHLVQSIIKAIQCRRC